MNRVLFWLNTKSLKEKGTWLSFLLLAICSVIVSGGVTHRNVLSQDIMLLNAAYSTSFETVEEFRAWFDLWQFQWLMGAFGQGVLFSVAVRLFPQTNAPEVQIPISCGYHRIQIWFASVIRFYGQVILLSVSFILLCAVFSGVRPVAGVTVLYYLRCILLHIWRDLGLANLALFFALLVKKRTPGLCLSFGLMLIILVFASSGLLEDTPVNVVLARMSRQVNMWMWQPHIQVEQTEIVQYMVFPLVTGVLANIVGLLRYRGDLA